MQLLSLVGDTVSDWIWVGLGCCRDQHGLEREFRFSNWLESDVCTMRALGKSWKVRSRYLSDLDLNRAKGSRKGAWRNLRSICLGLEPRLRRHRWSRAIQAARG